MFNSRRILCKIVKKWLQFSNYVMTVIDVEIAFFLMMFDLAIEVFVMIICDDCEN